MAKEKHLYKEGANVKMEADFERKYGPRGKEIYGAVLGKVAREKAAANGGTYVEEVKAHESRSATGTPEHVRGHKAIVHAHPHHDGHHGGRCGPACRASHLGHRHRGTRAHRAVEVSVLAIVLMLLALVASSATSAAIQIRPAYSFPLYQDSCDSL